jgi:hypothetical protein
LWFTLIYTIEGPITVVVAMVNICQIYPLFTPAAVIILILSALFFLYARPAITQCKQLDLASKSPVFHAYS